MENRERVLKDNPSLLREVLQEDTEDTWVQGYEIFYKPGHPAHREENIFFSYTEHPCAHRDWVAIELPETALLYDASCRDRCNPSQWIDTAVTIKQYQMFRERGAAPYGWGSVYNEHVIPDRVPSDRIVAYAKVEKEFLYKGQSLSNEILQKIKVFIYENLSFSCQFNNSEDSVLIHKTDTHYQIRIAYNTLKITNKVKESLMFFSQFDSLEGLVTASINAISYDGEQYQIKPFLR